MDLLRSDTLDWEQYPIIFNNKYTDTDVWISEDISAFQDAIYKSEKDFLQVSLEVYILHPTISSPFFQLNPFFCTLNYNN